MFCLNLYYFIEQKGGWNQFLCKRCGRSYNRKDNLLRHQRFECGKEPQWQCPVCPYKAKQKGTLRTHLLFRHPHAVDVNSIEQPLQKPLQQVENGRKCITDKVNRKSLVHFCSSLGQKIYCIHSMHLIICQGTVEKGQKCSRRQSEEYGTHVFYSSIKPPNFRVVRIVYKFKNKELDSVNVLCFLHKSGQED